MRRTVPFISETWAPKGSGTNPFTVLSIVAEQSLNPCAFWQKTTSPWMFRVRAAEMKLGANPKNPVLRAKVRVWIRQPETKQGQDFLVPGLPLKLSPTFGDVLRPWPSSWKVVLPVHPFTWGCMPFTVIQAVSYPRKSQSVSKVFSPFATIPWRYAPDVSSSKFVLWE